MFPWSIATLTSEFVVSAIFINISLYSASNKSLSVSVNSTTRTSIRICPVFRSNDLTTSATSSFKSSLASSPNLHITEFVFEFLLKVILPALISVSNTSFNEFKTSSERLYIKSKKSVLPFLLLVSL